MFRCLTPECNNYAEHEYCIPCILVMAQKERRDEERDRQEQEKYIQRLESYLSSTPQCADALRAIQKEMDMQRISDLEEELK